MGSEFQPTVSSKVRDPSGQTSPRVSGAGGPRHSASIDAVGRSLPPPPKRRADLQTVAPGALRTRSGHGLRPPRVLSAQHQDSPRRERGDKAVMPRGPALPQNCRRQPLGAKGAGVTENPLSSALSAPRSPAAPTPARGPLRCWLLGFDTNRKENQREGYCETTQLPSDHYGEFFILVFAIQNETWR